ncbi:hypothetical protein [Pseudoalteromonas sp. TB64]|uniref:hypothetical protein n=1 Tax=Pseudoalteromonas sp. TB64 TaxID=1938600 RepID=UPI0004179C33|nr:hypothetical protein [Pseudoalteromonas sp. TB64]
MFFWTWVLIVLIFCCAKRFRFSFSRNEIRYSPKGSWFALGNALGADPKTFTCIYSEYDKYDAEDKNSFYKNGISVNKK